MGTRDERDGGGGASSLTYCSEPSCPGFPFEHECDALECPWCGYDGCRCDGNETDYALIAQENPGPEL